MANALNLSIDTVGTIEVKGTAATQRDCGRKRKLSTTETRFPRKQMDKTSE